MGGSTLYVEAARVDAGEGKGSLRTTGAARLVPYTVSPRCLRCYRHMHLHRMQPSPHVFVGSTSEQAHLSLHFLCFGFQLINYNMWLYPLQTEILTSQAECQEAAEVLHVLGCRSARDIMM